MSEKSRGTPAVLLSGDTLALDPAIRSHIDAEADRLVRRHPSLPLTLRIAIGEELDPRKGHRVRCELAADLPGRKLVVREARRDAAAAIAAAFGVARKQLRKIRSQGQRVAGDPAGKQARPAGT